MYGAKSKYRRKYARKGRSKVAAIAKGKTTGLQAVAKQVRHLTRQFGVQKEYLNYSQTFSEGVISDVSIFHLSNFSGWARIFGTAADDDTENKMIHKSCGMDMYLTLENTVNEPDTVEFTCFLVSLKDNIGQNFNPATGGLSLVNNFHYAKSGGLVMLNKKVFNVHKAKRMVLTNHGSSLSNPSAQTQYGTDRRWYWKQRVGKTILNPYGNWKDLVAAPDPSKNYYILIFNDNSSLDLQNPNFQLKVVHTVQTV